MTEMLRLFRQDDPYITLTGGTDCICASCPHSLSHVCDAAEKVQRYDSAVLMFCGLSVGSVLRWSIYRPGKPAHSGTGTATGHLRRLPVVFYLRKH